MWPNKKISKLLFVCSETSKSNGVKLENSYRNSDTSPYVECLSLLKKGIQEVNYRLCWIVNVLLTKLRKQKIMISGEWIGRIWRMLFKMFSVSLSLYVPEYLISCNGLKPTTLLPTTKSKKLEKAFDQNY